MKRIAILLIGVSLLLGSCKKKLDQPDITPFPSGVEWTVGQILDTLGQGSFQFDKEWHKDAIVKGYVIADETGGNIYRTFYLRGTDGRCIAVYRKGASDGGSDEFNVKVGDYIGYSLYGSVISEYNKLPQIQVQEHDVNKLIVIYEKECYDKVQPVRTTITRINEGDHLCDLVTIDSVQFESYEGLTYAEGTSNTNRMLSSCSGESIIVRTSGYASFAADPLPSGRGELTSIASVYNTTWQLLIRKTSDVKLHYPRCGEGGETMELPYTQIFTSSFGTYTTYNVTGTQTWIIDYSTAMMKGKVGTEFQENEDWLLSSPIHIASVEHAKAVVNYVAQFNGPDDDVTAQVSADYVYGEDPTTATWTKLPVSFPNTASFNDFMNQEISLDEYIGQTVTFAIKFVSSATQSRTIEIKSIEIKEGEPGGGGGQGGDVQPMPYVQEFANSFGTYTTKDVLGSQIWSVTSSYAKMTGYSGQSYANEDWLISSPVEVVNVEHAKAVVNYVAQYQAPSDNDITMQVSADYVFGDDPSTATWTELDVRYPNTGGWNDFQDKEASLDEFIGQTVTIAIKYVSTDNGSRTIEIKSITVQEGEAGGDTPPAPGTIFSETFAASQGEFTIQDVILPSALTYVWAHDSHGCMKANAFANSTNYESETWLISPAIDMSGNSNAVLTFDHAVNYLKTGTPSDFYSVLVSTDYVDGQPSTAHWTELDVANYPAGNNWTFVNSGSIDLSSYTGNANVRIAFKYTSMDDNAGCWEVKNVLISE